MLVDFSDIHWAGVAAGVLSFLFAGAFDWASMRGIRGLKQGLAMAAAGLHAYALWAVVAGGGALAVPAPLRLLGTALLLPTLLLLVYSFLIEIPFAKTYARSGSSEQLVTTGTYALVRHPGVLWYTAFLVCLLAASGSATLVVAAPFWVLLDVLYVHVQERYFFHRMFVGYRDYASRTPMLVPNSRSLRRCLATLRHRRESA